MTSPDPRPDHPHSGEPRDPDNNPRPVDELVAVAVAALTAAATRTRTTLGGQPLRIDFAEIACQVLTTVAANLGDVEELLAGRPGSWEADYIRQIVQSTAGEDGWALMAFRTDPIMLHLDSEEVFYDVGLDEFYLRDHATATAVVEAAATAGQDTEQFEHAEQLLVAVEELYEQDLDAYHGGYEQTVRAELAERGITIPVQLLRIPLGVANTDAVDEGWLAEQLHEFARARTPLPATGQPPDWAPGATAAAVTAAGRSYLDRARAQLDRELQ